VIKVAMARTDEVFGTRRVERRHVAGILWPLGHDSRAAGNLGSALWRLRGAGIDILQTDKWSIALS
jgi:DNA-binding SARP family transcriptional activator